jgi:hypothetical protein
MTHGGWYALTIWLLMTVSTASILVLHSVEVAHHYPQAMLPICQEKANPIHLYRGGEAG